MFISTLINDLSIFVLLSCLLVVCSAYRNKNDALNYVATGGKVFLISIDVHVCMYVCYEMEVPVILTNVREE